MQQDRRVLKHLIDLDGGPKKIPVLSDPFDVSLVQLPPDTKPTQILFFAEGTLGGRDPQPRTFQVFRTNDPLPDGAVHRGTASTQYHEAWHLYELMG